jgi:hypothetical protein
MDRCVENVSPHSQKYERPREAATTTRSQLECVQDADLVLRPKEDSNFILRENHPRDNALRHRALHVYSLRYQTVVMTAPPSFSPFLAQSRYSRDEHLKHVQGPSHHIPRLSFAAQSAA